MKGLSGLPDITEDIVREYITITERFCAGRITKVEAIVELYESIPGHSCYRNR